MDRKWKEWKIREEQYVIDNHMLSVELLAHELNRTKLAIMAKIKKLKLEGKIKKLKREPRKAHEIFQWEKRNPETR